MRGVAARGAPAGGGGGGGGGRSERAVLSSLWLTAIVEASDGRGVHDHHAPSLIGISQLARQLEPMAEVVPVEAGGARREEAAAEHDHAGRAASTGRS